MRFIGNRRLTATSRTDRAISADSDKLLRSHDRSQEHAPLTIQDVPADMLRKLLSSPVLVHFTKRGFTFPWDIWLRHRLRPEVEAILYESPAAEESGVNTEEVRPSVGPVSKA